MTTMSQRWWAPAEPGIGPDEFDLSLFEPGSEPDKDLGQQVLGLHRVGAAACEAVATQPLADEVTLRAVLATAREMVAPPAVAAVSKAFDTPTYGALLLKDLLDDAEQAAVSLYRTCITKQMAPSVAAHRVGLVYGVPLRELGRYTMLATDPKANKQAVEELADRTLFGFVSKLVTDEAPTGGKELVSKAPEDEPQVREQTQTRFLQALFDQAEAKEQSDYLDEHHVENDQATGQFVRQGTGLRRGQLQRGKLRRGKLRREPVVRGKEGLEQQGLQTQSRAGGRTRQGLTRAARDLQKLIAPLEVPPITAATGRLPDEDDDAPDYLSRRHDRNEGEYSALYTGVSFVMPGEEWNARKLGMAEHKDEYGRRILFRARALEGAGPFEDDGGSHLEGAHARARAVAAAAVHEQFEGQPKPEVTVIKGAAYTLTDKADIAKAKREYVRKLDKAGVYGRLNISDEVGFVREAASHDNPEDLVLVWQPPTPGRPTYDRPVKVVTEVWIDEDNTTGLNNPSKYSGDIGLDPNQPLEIRGSDTYWRSDERGGYFITAYDASEAVEEDLERAATSKKRRGKFGKGLVISKAINEREAQQLSALQQMFDQAESRYLDEHNVDNDQKTGRFVRRGQLQRSNLRRGKLIRTEQLDRTQARETQGLEQQGRSQARESVQLDRQQREQVADAVKTGADKQTVFLDDGFEYHVLDQKKLGFLLDDSNIKYLEASYDKPFVPGWSAMSMLSDMRQLNDADGARMELITEAELRFRDAERNDRDGTLWKPMNSYLVYDDKDLPEVARDIQSRLVDASQIQMLRTVIHKRNDAYLVQVLGNSNDMGDGHMVRFEPGQQGPFQLRSEGMRRLTNARGIEYWLKLRFHGGRHIGATGSTDHLPVPLVHTWAAEDHYDAP